MNADQRFEDIELTVTLTVAKGLKEDTRERMVTALHRYAHTMMYVVEAGVRVHKPSDLDLRFLHSEVHHAGELIRQIDPGEVFGAMTCDEAEALADVFAAAGDQLTHDHILFSHGIRDQEPEDKHHTTYLEARNDNEL